MYVKASEPIGSHLERASEYEILLDHSNGYVWKHGVQLSAHFLNLLRGWPTEAEEPSNRIMPKAVP